MRDQAKFNLTITAGALLCAAVILFNLAGQYLLPDMLGHYERKTRFESMVSKGAQLHPARYWSGADKKPGQ